MFATEVTEHSEKNYLCDLGVLCGLIAATKKRRIHHEGTKSTKFGV